MADHNEEEDRQKRMKALTSLAASRKRKRKLDHKNDINIGKQRSKGGIGSVFKAIGLAIGTSAGRIKK